MADHCFFSWHDDIRVVHGVRRAAIYDFETGIVYTLNSAAAHVTKLIEEGVPQYAMEPRAQIFVNRLLALNLGFMSGVPYLPPQEPSSDHTLSLQFLWLELTGSCNLACAHCYAETQNPVLMPVSRYKPLEPGLNRSDWERVLRQAADLGCGAVQFIGGEVLLNKDLLTLVDIARDLDYSFIEIYTNGLLLTDRMVKELAKRAVHVTVSLHGTRAEIHDSVTGLKGSYEKTVAGIHRLVNHGVSARIAGVAIRSNQDDILHLDRLASELGLPTPGYDIVRAIGSGMDDNLVPDSPESLAPKWLTEPDFHADPWAYHHNRHWNPCWAGKIAITSTGDVMPCIMGRADIIGNIQDQSLANIIKSPNLLSLWCLTKDQVEICRDCEYRYVCGDCRPIAHSTGGTHHSPYPRCTYNPTSGIWKLLQDDSKYLSPAPEGEEPDLHGVTKEISPDIPKFKCTPNRLLDWQYDRFSCDPNRDRKQIIELGSKPTLLV